MHKLAVLNFQILSNERVLFGRTDRAFEKNFSRGYEGRCRAPKSLPQMTKKKRSSLKFSPILCPKLGEDQKKKVFTEIQSHVLPKTR